MRGGKGYAPTPMGQVHYRLIEAGEGPVLMLLHQTPWSMNQFAQIQACLAERGISSLAIDTPGYGMSDPPAGRPTIADYADNIVPVLNALDLQSVIAMGHHTGAAIAASFAARHPERTAGLMLHGTPLYSHKEREEHLAAGEHAPELSEDGSHLSDYFRLIRDYVGHDPRTVVTANWSTINWYLAGGFDVAHDSVYHNDLGADLMRVTVPVLILSDAADSLHVNDQRAAALRPRFRYHQFSELGSHAMMMDPAAWTELAAEFTATIGVEAEPSQQ